MQLSPLVLSLFSVITTSKSLFTGVPYTAIFNKSKLLPCGICVLYVKTEYIYISRKEMSYTSIMYTV